MEDSYFELLAGQQGFPVKTFDPLGEMKRLRRGLALRLQNLEQPVKDNMLSAPAEIEMKYVSPVLPHESVTSESEPPPMEPISLESVVKKADDIKNTLTMWQRSRYRAKATHIDIFRGDRRFWNGKRVTSVVTQYLAVPQERILEHANAGLIAIGVIGVIFGFLNVLHGYESGLSLGTVVCCSGASIIAIGLGGNFLASRVCRVNSS